MIKQIITTNKTVLERFSGSLSLYCYLSYGLPSWCSCPDFNFSSFPASVPATMQSPDSHVWQRTSSFSLL